MKRSNKLLIGLLLAIFIVPLGLFMAFNQMVKGDNYITIQNNNYIVSKETGSYHTVKITVPELKNINNQKVLTCHLHSANKGHYTFRKITVMDSVSITNERDTLFVKYIVKPHANASPTYYAYYDVDLYLPDMKDIIVDRATLQIDSVDAAINPDINIRLTNSIFLLGDGINTTDPRNPLDELQKTDPADKKDTALFTYGNLSVSAETSQLIFGYHLQIDTLSLNVGKGAKLTIANDFHTEKIKGTINPQTTIISNIRTIKQLSSLNSQ